MTARPSTAPRRSTTSRSLTAPRSSTAPRPSISARLTTTARPLAPEDTRDGVHGVREGGAIRSRRVLTLIVHCHYIRPPVLPVSRPARSTAEDETGVPANHLVRGHSAAPCSARDEALGTVVPDYYSVKHDATLDALAPEDSKSTHGA